MLAGRAELIKAARANGNPHAGIGRGMKVSKEAMAGLWVALDLFQRTDHEAEYRTHLAQAEAIVAGLAARTDLICEMESDWADWPAPVVWVRPVNNAWEPRAVVQALAAGDPAVHVSAHPGRFQISTHCLRPGEELIFVDQLSMILDRGLAKAKD